MTTTTQYNSVNYFLDNNTNLYQDITNTTKHSVSITPIYDVDANIENKLFSANNNQSPSNISTTVKEENKEVSMAEILTNYNYDKTSPTTLSSDKNENINNINSENDNNYLAKSPEFTRKNRFLTNNETYSGSTLYTKSPVVSTTRQRNASYDYTQVNNTYSQNLNQNSLKDENYILYASSSQDKNIIPNSYIGDISNFADNSNYANLYNVDTALIYPSASTHINYTNTQTNDIQLNQDLNQIYTDSKNNNALSSINNVTYYTSSSPVSPTTETILNNIDSTSLQTINNIPVTETIFNPTNYIYQVNSDGSITYIPTTSANQDTSNQVYTTNYIITPSTSNQIQYPLTQYNNLNTNISPSTANLIPSSTYQTKYYTGGNYSNYVGQNNALLSPYYFSSLNKNPYLTTYQLSSPIVSNFNDCNNLKHKDHKKSTPSFSNFSEDQSDCSSITQTDNFKKIQKKGPYNYRKASRGRSAGSRNRNPNNNNHYNQIKTYRNPSIKIRPDEYYTQYMFEHINLIRTKPQSFIPKIRNGIENISYDKRGNLIYKGNLKVALYKGKRAFEEAIADLNEIEPMEPLIFKKELCIDISNVEKEFTSGDYLRRKIGEKIDDGISIRAFWRDIIKDPKINFLLMIVDDNPIKRGDKRKDILDPNMRYIGISSGYLGNNFVCYTVLSNE